MQLLRVLPARWATPKATCIRRRVIFDKIQETIDLGGTGMLMQGGLHPDLKIEWYEDLLRSIKAALRYLVPLLFRAGDREHRRGQRA